MIANFHFLSGKALFGATVDDEPKNYNVKQNGKQCIGSREMLSFPSSIP